MSKSVSKRQECTNLKLLRNGIRTNPCRERFSGYFRIPPKEPYRKTSCYYHYPQYMAVKQKPELKRLAETKVSEPIKSQLELSVYIGTNSASRISSSKTESNNFEKFENAINNIFWC